MKLLRYEVYSRIGPILSEHGYRVYEVGEKWSGLLTGAQVKIFWQFITGEEV